MKYLFTAVSFILVHQGFSQDVAFPRDEVISHLSGNYQTITERIPIYIPGRCGENMLLYPGAGPKSTWSCDCKPSYLYFPLSSTCHEAFRQGPCPVENYVYKPLDDAVPICVRNPCKIDGLVPYKGFCQEMGSTCDTTGVLRVNSATFQIECVFERS